MAKEKDAVIKQFISQPEVFCDLYNGALFGGKAVFTPGMLQDSSGESSIGLVDKDGKRNRIHRYRDVVKKICGNTWLVVLACENQSEIHYGMAVRNMLYDALSYSEQMQQMAADHKKKKDLNSASEFLSGMAASDRLSPVITVVFYYGKEPWDGALCLHDMMNIPEDMELIKPFLPNYNLNLIHWKNVIVDDFKTDLRKIFAILPFASDKNGMKKFVQEHHADYESLQGKTYEILLAILDEKRFLKEYPLMEGEEKNMCKAFDDMKEEGREEGREELILNMIAAGLSTEMIAKISKLPPEQIVQWAARRS